MITQHPRQYRQVLVLFLLLLFTIDKEQLLFLEASILVEFRLDVVDHLHETVDDLFLVLFNLRLNDLQLFLRVLFHSLSKVILGTSVLRGRGKGRRRREGRN